MQDLLLEFDKVICNDAGEALRYDTIRYDIDIYDFIGIVLSWIKYLSYCIVFDDILNKDIL